MEMCLFPNTNLNGGVQQLNMRGNEWTTGVYIQFEGVRILEHCARSNKSTNCSTHIYVTCPKGGHYA